MDYCRSCDREFRNTAALRQHLQASSLHAYVCLRCLRSFDSSSARKQHILNSSSHNICTDCSPGRDFTTRDALDEHAQAEHNCCTTCNIKFNTPGQLFQHDVAKHNMCETCRMYFDTPSNLKSVRSPILSSTSSDLPLIYSTVSCMSKRIRNVPAATGSLPTNLLYYCIWRLERVNQAQTMITLLGSPSPAIRLICTPATTMVPMTMIPALNSCVQRVRHALIP